MDISCDVHGIRHSNGIPVNMSFGGTPLTTSFGTTLVTTSLGGTPLNTSLGGLPVTASIGGTPVNTSFGRTPVTMYLFEPAAAASFGGTPLNTSLGGVPVTASFGGTPLNTSLGGLPVTASFGGTPVNTSFGGKPVNTSFGRTPVTTSLGGLSVTASFGGTPVTTSFGETPVNTSFGMSPVINSSKRQTVADTNQRLLRFVVGKIAFSGRLCLSDHVVASKSYVGIQTSKPCQYGISKTENSKFSCTDKKGIVVLKENVWSCSWNMHKQFAFSVGQVIDEGSICCMCSAEQLSSYPNIKIGTCFFLKPNVMAIRVVGQCIWMGQVNNVDCIAGRMKEPIGASMSLTFDTMDLMRINENTVLVRAKDVMVPTKSEKVPVGISGLISFPPSIDFVKMNSLSIGLRVKVKYNLLNMDQPTETIYGTVKWSGTIKGEECVGIESDYAIVLENDPVILKEHLFDPRPGRGILVIQNDVKLDTSAYLPAFTTNIRNLPVENNGTSWFVEKWDSDCVKMKHLKKGMKVFMSIEKRNRKVQNRGILEIVGVVKGDIVGIVKVNKIPEIGSYLSRYALSAVSGREAAVANEMLKQFVAAKESPENLSDTLLLVDVNYIFRYSELDFNVPHAEDCLFLERHNKTPYGIVKWKGVDCDDKLFYGFITTKPSHTGTDGTFYGQRLFDCPHGRGTLVAATDISHEFNATWRHFSSEKTILHSEEGNSDLLDFLIEKALEENDFDSLSFILKNLPHPIHPKTIPQVVKALLKSRNYQLIKSVLRNYSSDSNRDSLVLSAAAECLIDGQDWLCVSLLEDCENKDTLLNDGETFLTSVIKRNVSESIILKIFEEGNFDPSKCNVKNESPKLLACHKAMLDLLKIFLSCA